MTEQPITPTTQTSDDTDLMTAKTTIVAADINNVSAKTETAEDKQDTLSPHPIFEAVSQRCLITANQLKRYSAASILPTDTRTAPDLDIGFGQQRALKALHTALDIKASGSCLCSWRKWAW